MNNQTQTHYRKVFKSDHLGVADLEEMLEQGSDLIFTVKYVRQEYGTKVAGKKIDANIAYFVEGIKPLVVNAGNSKVMRDLSGSPFVENWGDRQIKLYIDHSARLKGEVVGGVRISPTPITKQKPEVTPDNPTMWTNAKNAYIRDGNFSKVLERAKLSTANEKKIIDEVNAGV
ncbi:MAG: hypothetical protein ACYSWP_16980 [Planctomycetota bacterium]|jgi:hypothetical protein